ncbi:hypothetical protein ACSNOI_10205 [Actinomadura kijaniata]|uniref:hypothetical protein n=1 Tax=Actinomadura kijaniata TaxID=46161 RepID=UPI003F1B6E8B
MAEHTVTVNVENGCYHLVDPASVQPLLYYAGRNGLIGVLGDGAACVCTGTLDGEIRLTVLACQEPPASDIALWDEVVEISFVSPSGQFGLAAPQTAVLPNLATSGSGTYRLRVHARGRDAAKHTETARSLDQTAEEHLIISWPSADSEQEVTLQSRDQVGVRLRNSPASNPQAALSAMHAPLDAEGVRLDPKGRVPGTSPDMRRGSDLNSQHTEACAPHPSRFPSAPAAPPVSARVKSIGFDQQHEEDSEEPTTQSDLIRPIEFD